MTTKKYSYDPIRSGYEWEVNLNFVGVSLFPEGSILLAQVRASHDTPILGTLTTATGTLNRIDDNRLQIIIPGPMSARWRCGSIRFDVVRVDVTPAKPLGIRIEVPVETITTKAA